MYFDVVMPLTLFAVTLLATLLNGKVEGKLKDVVEEKEFKTRDALLLVIMISVAVSIIVFVPQYAIMAVFLFSYSTLLYMFSYVFSNVKKIKAQTFCASFGIASLAAGIVGATFHFSNLTSVYGTAAFFGLAAYAFSLIIYEEEKPQNKERWYLGTLPPILFSFLYLFYNGTPIWFPYLLDMFGLTFAVLIILYLGTLFNWKNALIFAGLLTVMDIILVLVTGIMISAVKHISGLGLPVLVSMPTIPFIHETQGILFMSLGLGDFFFAGILATQTFKKFGKQTTVVAVAAMCISFAIYEVYLLNSTSFNGFPGTVMIISGWLPIIGYKMLKNRKQTKTQQ